MEKRMIDSGVRSKKGECSETRGEAAFGEDETPHSYSHET